jgi:hypothetical protein
MTRSLAVIAFLCISSVAHAQKATPEKKVVTAAEQCSRACTKLCFAADPLCINKCQARCTKADSPKR